MGEISIMASPRVFVSSTCYDLHEIRVNLRKFIESFDYISVMSDFGDIFYDYDINVQDSCINEIEKCQIFILIIGNNYGSEYYKHKAKKSPDSVTLTEFKKAISINIAKHIFINNFVYYDYKNYRRVLERILNNYFETNDVDDQEIQVVKDKLRDELDSKYFFPHDSYKYIFKFLDIINDLNINNAIFEYQTAEDIQNTLRKQWAGYIYEQLSNRNKESNFLMTKTINEMMSKINSIDKLLNGLLTQPISDGKLDLDIGGFYNQFNLNKLEDSQQILSDTINDIIYESTYNGYEEHERYEARGKITEELTQEKIITWLDTLDTILKKFKWSKTISFNDIFSIFRRYEYSWFAQIDFKTIFTLHNLYNIAKSNPEDKDSFSLTIYKRLKSIEELDSIDEEIPF